ncbi:MAG TPA: pitrilysin family protein [Burkholderiales bacterium]
MRTNAMVAGMTLLLASATAGAVPKIEQWTMANGTRVYFVRATELPLVQLRAVFDAAGSRDPADKSGLARMTNTMLAQGAADLDVNQIAAGFENLGAEFGASSERDMTIVELRSLSDAGLLDPALDLFAKVVGKPTFPVDALERERAKALVALQLDLQSPGAIAQKAFMRALYGDHPYANDPAGTAESLGKITRGDLVNHHKRYYTGATAWLAIVGNATTADAKAIAERALGRLPRGEAAPPLPAVKPLTKASREVIAFPAQQSHVLIGQPAIARDDPDYFPLIVGNYSLGGGGLVSRLSDEIREKRGYSYSVYSFFQPTRVAGPFTLGLQTRNAQRDKAIAVAEEVLGDYVKNGPTAQELEAAKRNLTGGFPLRLDSNKKLAENLAFIGFYGLPLTYFDDFVARVDAVTIEQIRAAFKRHIHPNREATVVVGGTS